MFVLLPFFAAAAPAVSASPANRPIVITAQRIDRAKDALRDCLARNCPPDKDIDATLALAETQLLAGKYHDARATLLASLGRNKDQARAYPIPVSDLYRANGRVAAHLGVDWDYYQSTWGLYRTLKYGLPPDDVRKFSALMEVAEMMYRTRGHERARRYYESVARQARQAGRPDIAAIAELRSAIRHLPPESSWQLNEIKRIAGLDGPQMRAPVLEAKLALARMAFLRGDEAGGQALQRELASLNIKRPILIYSPPYEMDSRDTNGSNEMAHQYGPDIYTAAVVGEAGGRQFTGRGGTSFSANRAAPVVEDMWMDVAFRITPDGRVADVNVARSHGDISWGRPLLASIRGRRYTPADPSSPTSRRLERYTYTSGFERKSNSHAAGRSPDTRVEYIDLSDTGGLTDSD